MLACVVGGCLLYVKYRHLLSSVICQVHQSSRSGTETRHCVTFPVAPDSFSIVDIRSLCSPARDDFVFVRGLCQPEPYSFSHNAREGCFLLPAVKSFRSATSVGLDPPPGKSSSPLPSVLISPEAASNSTFWSHPRSVCLTIQLDTNELGSLTAIHPHYLPLRHLLRRSFDILPTPHFTHTTSLTSILISLHPLRHGKPPHSSFIPPLNPLFPPSLCPLAFFIIIIPTYNPLQSRHIHLHICPFLPLPVETPLPSVLE